MSDTAGSGGEDVPAISKFLGRPTFTLSKDAVGVRVAMSVEEATNLLEASKGFGWKSLATEEDGTQWYVPDPRHLRYRSMEEAMQASANPRSVPNIPFYETSLIVSGTLANINPEYRDAKWCVVSFIRTKPSTVKQEHPDWKGVLWVNQLQEPAGGG